MKKTLTLIFVAAMSLSAFAEGFVGGSLNIGYQGSDATKKADDYVMNSGSFTFGLSPYVGWKVSDKFAAGFGVAYNASVTSQKQKTRIVDEVVTTINSKDVYNGFSVSPFVRYYFYSVKKFNFYLQGTVGLGYGNTKSTDYNVLTDETTVTKGNGVLNFNINIVPAISYSLTDKIDLEMQLNVLRLGYSLNHTKDENDYVTNTHAFNCAATSGNILGALGSIVIGFNYRF